MLNTTSIEEKGKFLINFTREIIRNTSSAEMYKLEEMLQKKDNLQKPQRPQHQKRNIKEEVKLILSKKQKKIEPKEITQEIFLEKSILPSRKEEYFEIQSQSMPRVPKIPRKIIKIEDHPLPERLQHLKATATKKIIDLKKLNPLVQDSNVKIIQCLGENEKIIVTGKMGKKPTGITLSKEEINEIIDAFAFNAKIPKNEGLFKVVYGKLILTAMVSNTINSTFIIKKIENQIPRPRRMPPHPIR